MLLAVAYTGDTGKATAAAGTAIKAMIPPRRGHKTRLTTLRWTVGTTAHTLTVLRPLAKTTLAAAALAGQAVVVLKVDPGTLLIPSRPLAVNDNVVVEGPTQNNLPTFVVGTVSAVAAGTAAGTLNVTLNANLPTGGLASGANFWMLGVTTDGHPQFTLAPSVTNLLQDTSVGFVGSRGNYEPLLLNSDNLTAAGTLENAAVAYTEEGGYVTPLLGGGGREGAVAAPEKQAQPEGDAGDAGTVIVLQSADDFKAAREAMGQQEHWQDPQWHNFGEDPVYYEGQPGDPEFKGGAGQPQQALPPPQPQPTGTADPGQGTPGPGEGKPPVAPTTQAGATDPGVQTGNPGEGKPPAQPAPTPGATDPGTLQTFRAAQPGQPPKG